MRESTQDPKYDIDMNVLINSTTGFPVPADEPIFIIRAKDKHAIQALYYYRNLCINDDHITAVEQQIEAFEQYANTHPDDLKEPDTENS